MECTDDIFNYGEHAYVYRIAILPTIYSQYIVVAYCTQWCLEEKASPLWATEFTAGYAFFKYSSLTSGNALPPSLYISRSVIGKIWWSVSGTSLHCKDSGWVNSNHFNNSLSNQSHQPDQLCSSWMGTQKVVQGSLVWLLGVARLSESKNLFLLLTCKQQENVVTWSIW